MAFADAPAANAPSPFAIVLCFATSSSLTLPSPVISVKGTIPEPSAREDNPFASVLKPTEVLYPFLACASLPNAIE